MGRAFECIGRLAGTPYTMKDTHVNIYSVEELCYHLVNNAELTGDLNDTEELADWLEQECATGGNDKGEGKALGYAGACCRDHPYLLSFLYRSRA